MDTGNYFFFLLLPKVLHQVILNRDGDTHVVSLRHVKGDEAVSLISYGLHVDRIVF